MMGTPLGTCKNAIGTHQKNLTKLIFSKTQIAPKKKIVHFFGGTIGLHKKLSS